jgi:hypothetical protein
MFSLVLIIYAPKVSFIAIKKTCKNGFANKLKQVQYSILYTSPVGLLGPKRCCVRIDEGMKSAEVSEEEIFEVLKKNGVKI